MSQVNEEHIQAIVSALQGWFITCIQHSPYTLEEIALGAEIFAKLCRAGQSEQEQKQISGDGSK